MRISAKKLYTIIYLVMFILSFLILFGNLSNSRWIPFFFFIVFAFSLFRYIIVLVTFSKYIKVFMPKLYKNHSGFSRFMGVRMISPTIIYGKEIYKIKDAKLLSLRDELRYLISLLVVSFILMTIMAMIVSANL